MIASHQGRPQLTAKTPEQAPTNAATDPTDRSMWPAMMTITMPIASTRMYPFWTIRFEMFCGRSRMPLVRIVNSSTTAIRAMKMPFLPRSATTWVSQREPVLGRSRRIRPAVDSVSSLSCCLLRAPTSAGLLHGHELDEGFGGGFLDGKLARDPAFGQGVDRDRRCRAARAARRR